MSLMTFSEKEISHGRTHDSQQPKPQEQEIRQFDLTKRWLKGDEYAYILQNIDLYCEKFGFQKFDSKCHPQSIYKNPINGLIYFVKGKGVGSEFGFPRVNGKKKYRWKKMNFTTDLPKKNPFVTYVVASAIKSTTLQIEKDLPDYRMHAVILCKKSETQENLQAEYILCHVREVQHKASAISQQMSLRTCFVDNKPDFCRLFLYLDNLKNRN